MNHATGLRSAATASHPSRIASSGIAPPPANGSSTRGARPPNASRSLPGTGRARPRPPPRSRVPSAGFRLAFPSGPVPRRQLPGRTAPAPRFRPSVRAVRRVPPGSRDRGEASPAVSRGWPPAGAAPAGCAGWRYARAGRSSRGRSPGRPASGSFRGKAVSMRRVSVTLFLSPQVEASPESAATHRESR